MSKEKLVRNTIKNWGAIIVNDKKSKDGKKWPAIKCIIGLLIALAGLIFICANYDVCYNKHRTPRMADPFQKMVPLSSDSVIEQEFVALEGTLYKVGMCTDNQGKKAATGSMTARVYDMEGNMIAEATKEASKVRLRKFTYFKFENPPTVKEGKSYKLVVTCNDFKNSQGFGVYTSAVNNSSIPTSGSIDGKVLPEGTHIRVTAVSEYYNYGLFRKMIALIVAGIIFILIPFGKIEELIEKKTGKRIGLNKLISRVLFVTSPIVAYFIVEILSGYTMSEVQTFLLMPKGIINMLIYAMMILVLYAITNKTQYSVIIMWVVSFIFAMTNYFVFSFRGIPVLAADILSIGTAINVAGGFEYSFDVWVLWSVAFLTTFSAIMFSLKPYKGFKLKKRFIPILTAIISFVFIYQFVIGTDIIEKKFDIEDSQWKPQRTYAKNGTALSFTMSWRYVKTEKPEGYSVDEVKKLTKNFTSDDTSKDNAKNKKMPNVIAIMNESLADFSYDGELETNKDYLPFIRSMKKNTIKGRVYVSIEGANTANSEFEFLTGNSMAFFAPRAVPYNNYVKDVVPSLTRTLKSQGYVGNNSYHPYKRSGWNRENVYRSLGFNHFFSEEHYENPEYMRIFISDKTNMETIIKDYEENRKEESGKPFYLFNVTVQNHGGYIGKRGLVDADVQITTPELGTSENNQYVTLARKSDQAFKKLIKYFEKVDEPTVIVMFGDHQPPLSTTFYSTLFGRSTNKLTTEQESDWYSTPYVIWANYDIEEKQNENMSVNYLSSYLLNLIGADLTGYNKYLLDLQKRIPVLTGLFYQGDDGQFYDIDEESKYTKEINEYSKIQYNGLLDKRNRLNDFFFLKDGDYEVKEESE